MASDIVALAENDSHDGEPLIMPVMQAGRRINESIPLDKIRRRTLENYARLPKPMTTLEAVPAYPVEISASLQALARRLDRTSGGSACQGHVS
jgi:nicotinate phosphoribosyltransferase